MASYTWERDIFGTVLRVGDRVGFVVPEGRERASADGAWLEAGVVRALSESDLAVRVESKNVIGGDVWVRVHMCVVRGAEDPSHKGGG